MQFTNALFTNKNDRGQVGIGTLIIFIAMVLVAAVAAGVLINTSGQLQARASDTGNDAQAQVSNHVDVVSVTGTVGTDAITSVDLVLKKSPGSDAIDTSSLVIYYTSDTASAELDSTSHSGDGVLENTGDRDTLTLDLSTIETTGLAEGESATLRIVDQSGATAVYVINVPDELGGKTYVTL